MVNILSGGQGEEEDICFHQVGAILLSDPGFCPARPAMHIHSIQQLVLSCPKDELLYSPSTFYSQAVHSNTKTSLGLWQEVWGMFRIGGRLGWKQMVVWQSDYNTGYLFQWIGHPAVKYCDSESQSSQAVIAILFIRHVCWWQSHAFSPCHILSPWMSWGIES